MYSELSQGSSVSGYTAPMSYKNILITDKEKKKLESSLKIGIYRELNQKSLLTSGQLAILIQKEKKDIQ